MKSKTIVSNQIQSLVDNGMRQYEVAEALGIDSPNYVSMLKNPDDKKALLSPDRIEQFAKICAMTPQEVMSLIFARLRDAEGRPIEMGLDTFKFLLVSFVACVDASRAATKGVA